jgi:hypothetical protein
MKFLLGLLVLANVALYLLWGPYELHLPSPPGAPDAQQGIALQLLSEVDTRQLQPVRAARPAAPVPAVEPVTPQAPAESESATDPGAAGQAAGAPSEAPREAPPRPARVSICYTLGTLTDRLLAERVRSDLIEAGLAGEIRTESRRGDLSGYWVILPPRSSLAQAQATVSQLQARGIDSFIISTGDYRNGVSLGFFHNRDSGVVLEGRIRGLGYNPRIIITHRSETVYWVDLDEHQSRAFKDAQWRTLADDYPMLGRYVRDCG